jgi:hypothetical protein
MPDESMKVASVESITTGSPLTSASPMHALASSRSAASISPTRTMTVRASWASTLMVPAAAA